MTRRPAYARTAPSRLAVPGWRTARVRRRGAAAQGHVRLAATVAADHWLRRALPFAITILLLGLLIAVVAAAVISRSGDDEDPGETIRMTNPRFLGRDADNQAS